MFGARRPTTVVLALAVSSASGCSNRLFLHPSHHLIETTARAESIDTTTWPIRGRKLDAFVQRLGPADCPPSVHVLAFHGNGSRPEAEIRHLRAIFGPRAWHRSCEEEGGGIELVAVAYPGFGADEGPATLRGLGAGALESYDWVRARAGDAPIVVYGMSMGTTAALHVARSRPDDPPAGLVLDRGPNIPRLLMGRFGWWNAWVLAGPVTASLPRAVRSRANARRVDGVPALFLLARDDRLARPSNAQTIVDAYAGPKHVAWFDGTHGAFIDGRVAAVRDGLDWLFTHADL